MLGGKSLTDYVASGAARSVYIIPDNYVLPESRNTTAGFGWQMSSNTGIEMDYVHAYGYNQLGALDLNLPATGRVSATNPRPVSQFTEVKSLENFTTSRYDALEMQFRTRHGRIDSLTVSYTLSGTRRDGVNHYQTYPGTMRTPQEIGYGEQDTRHNLSVSASTHPAVRRAVQRHPARAERHAVRRVGRLRHRRRRPDAERSSGRAADHGRPREGGRVAQASSTTCARRETWRRFRRTTSS